MNPNLDGVRLHEAVARLRDAVASSRLPLATPGVESARREALELVAQLDDYVLPRLESLDAPLLAVIGGSTGAGKSTLVNSIVREQVTRAGVLRPTTRASVLIHHPDDASWFTGDRVLPGLARLTGAPAAHDDPSSLRLVASSALPRGLALLDAPDIDSVVAANRDLARQLLSAADLWLFVTTAVRYADAVPWEMLEQASARGTSVAIVLDRVPREAMEEVRGDLARMLAAQGLGQSPVFAVAEATLDASGILPPHEVEGMSNWLHALASDASSRQVVIRRTLDGALDSLSQRARATATAVGEQTAAAARLRHEATDAYAHHREQIDAGLQDGTLLRGEVLARWQEFVGTGELFKQFEAGVGRLRDKVMGVVRGRVDTAAPAKDLGDALQTGVTQLVISHAESAALDAVQAWRREPAGKPLVDSHPELAQASPGLNREIERLVREWQGDVLALVRDEAGDRRATARFLAVGVNGIAVLLMLVTFASTYGLSGAEIGIAGGSAVVGQRVLEAIFGDQAVRRLAERSRGMLLERIDVVLDRERARYTAVLDKMGMGAGDEHVIEPALARVEELR